MHPVFLLALAGGGLYLLKKRKKKPSSPGPRCVLRPALGASKASGDALVNLGEAVRLCGLPESVTVLVPDPQHGFVDAPTSWWKRDGEKMTFSQPGGYQVGDENGTWFVVVDYLPAPPGLTIAPGTPEAPSPINVYTYQQVDLDGLGALAAAGQLGISMDGSTESPEVLQTGDLIRFPTAGTYTVAGTSPERPTWRVESQTPS